LIETGLKEDFLCPSMQNKKRLAQTSRNQLVNGHGMTGKNRREQTSILMGRKPKKDD